ncbi:MAG TPA: hypothetical protein VJ279_02265 [Hanamia sp.]|nr:hypothetical protein [Hanamia sp.]
MVDEEKNKVEIYCLENSKYVLQKNLQDIPFTFLLEDDCRIEVLLKNFWE